MKEIKVTRLTSLKGEDFLVQRIEDGNTIPEVNVFKQVNAYNVAEEDFGISPERENIEKKSKKNTREMWNEIFKKGTFMLILFLLFSLTSCKKSYSQEDVLSTLANSEWSYPDYGGALNKFWYFDANGVCYGEYFDKGQSQSGTKYKYKVMIENNSSGEQVINITLDPFGDVFSFNPQNPNELEKIRSGERSRILTRIK